MGPPVPGDRGRAGEAARRWARALAAWGIPDEILQAAPESPYGYDPARFTRAAEAAAGVPTPSRERALAALPEGGSVLDVGCGAGAAGLALVPPATRVVGVDASPAMLERFALRARALGVDHACVEGSWPEAAAGVEAADVVVCHHVVYNVPDLPPFFEALTVGAREHVVVELTAEHPQAWTRPLWRALHELDRPDGPVAADAAAVARELGLEPAVEAWEKDGSAHALRHGDEVAAVRRRLCVPPSRDGEVAAALERWPPPRTRPVVTLSWRGSA